MTPAARQPHAVIAIPVLLTGGTEFQTVSLVSVLISGGFGVTVGCYYEYDQAMVSAMEKAGARVILLGLRREDGLLSLLGKLRAFFRQIRPDIVHVQYIAPGFVPVLAAKIAGVTTVFATVHQPGRTYGSKERFLLRTASRLCTIFFCVSRSAEASWFGDSEVFNADQINIKRRHFTLYNAVDSERIRTISEGTDKKALKKSLGIVDKLTIGVVGRLRGEKGHALLLNAFTEILRKFPATQLLIVGDGPDREKLRKLAEDLKLTDNVRWSGQKSSEEVYRLYSVMDIVAVPSVFEGFGLAAAEAQAAGLPVIASAVDGLCEIIEEGVTGYLVPVNDARALASALIRLLANPEAARSMGINGRKRVSNLFSMARFSNAMLTAYSYFSDVPERSHN